MRIIYFIWRKSKYCLLASLFFIFSTVRKSIKEKVRILSVDFYLKWCPITHFREVQASWQEWRETVNVNTTEGQSENVLLSLQALTSPHYTGDWPSLPTDWPPNRLHALYSSVYLFTLYKLLQPLQSSADILHRNLQCAIWLGFLIVTL